MYCLGGHGYDCCVLNDVTSFGEFIIIINNQYILVMFLYYLDDDSYRNKKGIRFLYHGGKYHLK